MWEVEDGQIDLVVTSPPYWHIKDYGVEGQIGYGQSLHEYLKDLYRVWSECYRVLREGGRLCINIGDQFARSVVYGKYKVIPLHAEFIAQCEQIGFDFMGSIIWQKKTTINTTGGATVMGSFPYPPNGIVEIDYEFIHIFKKPGKAKKVSKEVKEASKLTKEEWKEYFSGHWYFGGAKQIEHEAMFPEELPRRLIKMFTFIGDTVLDPFLGSGTTVKVALELHRSAIGYEINKNFLEVIIEKLGMKDNLLRYCNDIQIVERTEQRANILPVGSEYVPRIKDSKPYTSSQRLQTNVERLYKVVEIVDESTIRLDTDLTVKFLGVRIDKQEDTIRYLKEYILGKNVFLRFGNHRFTTNGTVMAYVYLKNKVFVNAYLIKSGLASPDPSVDHKFKTRFADLAEETRWLKNNT